MKITTVLMRLLVIIGTKSNRLALLADWLADYVMLAACYGL